MFAGVLDGAALKAGRGKDHGFLSPNGSLLVVKRLDHFSLDWVLVLLALSDDKEARAGERLKARRNVNGVFTIDAINAVEVFRRERFERLSHRLKPSLDLPFEERRC